MSELYEDTRDLVLIPQVPKDIGRTFNAVKQLRTYAYYEDHFYTVAAHYAFLAVEAAIYARWSLTLSQKVTLTCGADSYELWHPTFTRIAAISQERWKGTICSRTFL